MPNVEKITQAVDRYLTSDETLDLDSKDFWGAAYPTRYYIEVREKYDPLFKGPLSKVTGLYKRWQLNQLHSYAEYSEAPESKVKNYAALNGLRFLRSIYDDLPLVPEVSQQLDRLENAEPENPLSELYYEAMEPVIILPRKLE